MNVKRRDYKLGKNWNYTLFTIVIVGSSINGVCGINVLQLHCRLLQEKHNF